MAYQVDYSIIGRTEKNDAYGALMNIKSHNAGHQCVWSPLYDTETVCSIGKLLIQLLAPEPHGHSLTGNHVIGKLPHVTAGYRTCSACDGPHQHSRYTFSCLSAPRELVTRYEDPCWCWLLPKSHLRAKPAKTWHRLHFQFLHLEQFADWSNQITAKQQEGLWCDF